MKTKFKYILLLVILLLHGCSQTGTSRLWTPPRYTEKINQFLINPKDKSLIVIGEKYHYIFDENSAPLNLLTWSGRKNLRAYFNDFKINSENIVNGSFTITCNSKKVSTDEAQWLKKNGFIINQNGFYNKMLKIKGTRYLKRNNKVNHLSHLNEDYYILVEEPNSTSDIIYKTVLTPITVTGDAVYVIGGIPLVLGLVAIILPIKTVVDGIKSVSE